MIQARIRKSLSREGDTPAFAMEIDFSASGAVTCVFGPPASGKTLLLDLLSGLSQPGDGRILLGEQIVFDSASGIHLPPRRRPCGYVFPAPALVPHLTLRQNLLFAALCRKAPRLERHRKVEESIERFELTGAAARLPGAVSASDRLRCAVARALISEPKLLLVDEPSPEHMSREELMEALRRIKAEGAPAILYATRRLEDCLELGGGMLVLESGRLLQDGPCREVLEQPAGAEAARLIGGFNLLPVSIAALDPVRNSSRLRLGEADLTGPYFPGHLRGDRVTLCVRYGDLRTVPASGKPGPNQLRLPLMRVSEDRQAVRLHFEGGITAEMPLAAYREQSHVRNWLVEFPADCLRVL